MTLRHRKNQLNPQITTKKATVNFNSKSEVTIFNTNERKKGNFNLGVFVNPEMIFYPSDDIPNKTNLNLNLSISYNFSNLFFESRLGIGLAKDNGNYNLHIATPDNIRFTQKLIKL